MYLAANHGMKEDIDERTCKFTVVNGLLKVSFDIVVFDLGWQREILFVFI